MRYYIHGYLSDPNSTKATLLKEKLNVKPITYRTCPPEKLIVSECLKKINKEIKDDEEITLIGSSLGGFLAAKTATMNNNIENLILLNPAIIPMNFDITKIKDMPQSILEEMQDRVLFTKKNNAEVLIIIGTKDEIVPNSWPIQYAKNQNATIKFLDDDHRFSEKIDQVISIIKGFLIKKD